MVLKTGTNEFRPTKAMIERYGARFAKAGYDIRKLRTREQWNAAVDASFALEMRTLASTTRGQDAQLDALLQGLPGWD